MKRIKGKELRFIGVMIGIFATLTIVFPALIVKDSDISYTGLQVVFGYEFLNLGIFGSGEIKFSALNLIAYSLPMIAALILLLSKKDKILSSIAFGLAVVMLLLVPAFTEVNIGGFIIDVSWKNASGLTIAVILSLIGLGIGLFRLIQKN